MHAALYSILSGAAGVTELVSTRIYLARAPQGAALPYVWFEDRSTTYIRALSGDQAYRRSLVDVNCIAASATEAIAVADAVTSAINDARGTYASTPIVNVAVLGDDTNTLPPTSGEEFGAFERSLDVEITWRSA